MKDQLQKNYFLSCLFLLMPTYTYVFQQPNTVVGTINVGVTPVGLAVTPDNRFAYVANNNNYGVSSGDTISVLDLTNNTLRQTISDPSFNQPYSVTMNSSGTRAYVTNSNSTTVSILNPVTNAVLGVIDGFDGPSGMVVNSAGTRGYVNNYGSPVGVGSGNATTVRVVDLNTNAIIGEPITVGVAPAALAISPQGDYVYAVNYGDGNPGTGTLSVIQASDNMVVDTVTGFSGPFSLAVTPDGNYAYVTNFGSNNFDPIGSTVSVVDLNADMIIKTINVGMQPSGISISPDGRYVYVTNYNTLYAGSDFSDLTAGQGTVSIIDTATNEVVSPTIAVGQSPSAITISPDGEFAYVSNFTSNTVDVIALQSFEITATGCKMKRKCSKKGERVNKLTWQASGSSLPVSYALYRDAGLNDFVATIPARCSSALRYFDTVHHKQNEYVYYLVGTNDAGTNSEPVEIVVNKTCKKCSNKS